MISGTSQGLVQIIELREKSNRFKEFRGSFMIYHEIFRNCEHLSIFPLAFAVINIIKNEIKGKSAAQKLKFSVKDFLQKQPTQVLYEKRCS